MQQTYFFLLSILLRLSSLYIGYVIFVFSRFCRASGRAGASGQRRAGVAQVGVCGRLAAAAAARPGAGRGRAADQGRAQLRRPVQAVHADDGEARVRVSQREVLRCQK